MLAPATGTYRFQTVSDDGIRLWVNGVQLINNWTAHSSTINTSGTINLVAGTSYSITLEFYEGGGSDAEARLQWLTPGNSSYAAIPTSQLFQETVTVGTGHRQLLQHQQPEWKRGVDPH